MKKLFLMLAVSGTVVAMEREDRVEVVTKTSTKQTEDDSATALEARKMRLYGNVVAGLHFPAIRSSTRRNILNDVDDLLIIVAQLNLARKQEVEKSIEARLGRTNSGSLPASATPPYTMPPVTPPTAPLDGSR